jgi:phosphoglycolate phosphatase
MGAKHIIFDWNSTLLDDIGALHGCTNRLLESEGHPPVTLEFFQAHYDIPFQRLYQNLGLSEAQIKRLIDANNSAFHEHYEPMAHAAPLRDGAMDILNHAKQGGIESYILSNHVIDPIRTQLRRLKIEHFFTDVLAYADRAAQRHRHMSKGDKLKHMRVAEGLEPDPMIVVGDSVEEIEIAREQNLISVAITGGCVSEERLRATKPDYIIHSLHELKPIMQERGFVT